MRLVLMLLVLVMTAQSGMAVADDAVNRIGISVGGVKILGIHIERVYDDYTIRTEVGILRSAISFNISAVRFLDDERHRPYVGLGYLKYLDVAGFQNDDILCVPAGVDFELDDRDFMHAEFTSCVSFQTLRGNPPDRETLYYRLMPKPSMTVKRAFQ